MALLGCKFADKSKLKWKKSDTAFFGIVRGSESATTFPCGTFSSDAEFLLAGALITFIEFKSLGMLRMVFHFKQTLVTDTKCMAVA